MPIRQNVLINESDIRNLTGTVLQQTNESIGSDLTNKNMENVCRTQTALQYIVNKEAEYRQIDGTTFFRFEPNIYNIYWHPMRLSQERCFTIHASESDNSNCAIQNVRYLYLLLSESGEFYIGFAENIEKVFKYLRDPNREHNWKTIAVVDGVSTYNYVEYAFKADDIKCSLLETDKKFVNKRGLVLLAEWVAEDELLCLELSTQLLTTTTRYHTEFNAQEVIPKKSTTKRDNKPHKAKKVHQQLKHVVTPVKETNKGKDELAAKKVSRS